MVVDRNGFRGLILWSTDTIMETSMVDALLDDMGVGEEGSSYDQETREAVREYCVERLEEAVGHGDGVEYTQSELECMAWGEFLEMLLVRTEAELERERGSSDNNAQETH